MTKASLRHITANDEASSLSGDFIIAHHSPAVMKIEMKLWPQNRSFPCNGEKEYETQAAILKFYICADVSHTHTHTHAPTHTRTYTYIYTQARASHDVRRGMRAKQNLHFTEGLDVQRAQAPHNECATKPHDDDGDDDDDDDDFGAVGKKEHRSEEFSRRLALTQKKNMQT